MVHDSNENTTGGIDLTECKKLHYDKGKCIMYLIGTVDATDDDNSKCD